MSRRRKCHRSSSSSSYFIWYFVLLDFCFSGKLKELLCEPLNGIGLGSFQLCLKSFTNKGLWVFYKFGSISFCCAIITFCRFSSIFCPRDLFNPVISEANSPFSGYWIFDSCLASYLSLFRCIISIRLASSSGMENDLPLCCCWKWCLGPVLPITCFRNWSCVTMVSLRY